MTITINTNGTQKGKAVTTLSWAPTGALAVGDYVIACTASDDSVGMAWKVVGAGSGGADLSLTKDVESANAGNAVSSIWSGRVLTAKPSGTTHTLTVTNSQALAATLYIISGLVTTAAFDKSGTAIGVGNPWARATSATPLAQTTEAIVGCIAIEGPIGDATGSWFTGTNRTSENWQRNGTTGGGAASNMTVDSATILATDTATAAETYLDNFTARDSASVVVTYKGVTGNTYTRASTNTLAFSTAATKRAGSTYKRPPSRVGSISPTLTRPGSTYKRTDTRSGTIAAAVAKSFVRVRSVTRVGTIATALARKLTAVRGVSRTGTFSGALARAGSIYKRVVSRTGAITATLGRAGSIYKRALSRVGTVVATLGRASSIYKRALSRVGTITATPGRASSIYKRALSRNGTVAGSVTRLAAKARSATRVGTIAASLGRVGSTYKRVLSRTGVITGAVGRKVTALRSLSRAGSIVAALARQGSTYKRLSSRAGTITAAAVRVYTARRTLTRSGSVAASVVRQFLTSVKRGVSNSRAAAMSLARSLTGRRPPINPVMY